MAVLEKRTCDVCGVDIKEGEVVGQLWLPGGTPEEIHQRVNAEVEKLNPVVLMMQPGVVQEIAKRHHGTRWDVCRPCVEGLTSWSQHRFFKWAAAGFRVRPEGQ